MGFVISVRISRFGKFTCFCRPLADLTPVNPYGKVGTMKRAYLFPGQGAQYPGMGIDLFQHSERVKELFYKASDLTHMNLFKILSEGKEEELKSTQIAQVVITLVNLSVAEALRERGIYPKGVAGFSLGEYAALAEAGVLSIEDTFKLVQVRGMFMEQASRKWDRAEGQAGMAAVIGLEAARIEEILQGIEEVYPANYNSPLQTVISGTARGLALAEEKLKQYGAKRVIRLKVSGPFHSPLLKEARERFEAVLEEILFQDPRIPVYSNVTGQRIASGQEAKRLAGEQITSPVRWTTVEEEIKLEGYDELLETGPGTVLTGLWKAFYTEPVCLPVGKWEELIKIEIGG
ncbi:MAG: ACP S-malonyltransferase [Spirochaetes bacterium]|nr:ACP S-malonyltransferase [Spirochaetota bacterium]